MMIWVIVAGGARQALAQPRRAAPVPLQQRHARRRRDRLYLGFISAISRLYLGYISAISRLYLTIETSRREVGAVRHLERLKVTSYKLQVTSH